MSLVCKEGRNGYRPTCPSLTSRLARLLSFLGGSIPLRTGSQLVFHPVGSSVCGSSAECDGTQKLTVPMVVVSKPARASIPRIRDISWTSCFVSRALVDLDLNWEIFARKQGCWETWTLLGREAISRKNSRKDSPSRSHPRSRTAHCKR